MQEFSDDIPLQTYTAFSLLKAGEHTDEAEAVLVKLLNNAGTFSIVITVAESSFTKHVSDNLFNELSKAVALFPEQAKMYLYPVRIARIDENRRHKIITKDCGEALATNVIPFPKRN